MPEKENDPSAFAKGYKAVNDHECLSCHTYKGEGGPNAPDFTGYGDAAWLRKMITTPFDPSRYGTRNRMPAFRDLEGLTGEELKEEVQRSKNQLLEKIDANDKEKRKHIEDAHTVMQLIGTMRNRFSRGDTYESSDIGTTQTLRARKT